VTTARELLEGISADGEWAQSVCCLGCRYFEPLHPRSDAGWCRRYAPRPALSGDNFFRAVWPNVSARDWCGEFESKSEANPR
jgi:hypothetical protein